MWSLLKKNKGNYVKIFSIIIVIIAYILFITSFTIIAIDIIFPNIKMPFVGISIVFLIITFFLMLFGTLIFLNEPYIKEVKHYAVKNIVFKLNIIYFIVSSSVLCILLFLFLLGSIASGFWNNDKELNLGFDSKNLVSGDLYIGDIVNETDIEIKFKGKVNLDNVLYLKTNNIDVKKLKINENIIDVLENESTYINNFDGICDYELEAYLNVNYITFDVYRGFYLKNPYNKNIDIKLSPNYMINANANIYNHTLLICDKGTPYQYRYPKFEIILRWIMLVEYLISTPLFIYYGVYYSFYSIKNLKKERF